jgi:hypothetical protein
MLVGLAAAVALQQRYVCNASANLSYFPASSRPQTVFAPAPACTLGFTTFGSFD